MHVIEQERSIIPACDCDWTRYLGILEGTEGVEKVGGYKLGLLLAIL